MPLYKNKHNFDDIMLEVLREKWSFNTFRHMQREIVTCVLSGGDCFVVMPTGFGKSLCYQLPAVIEAREKNGKGTTVVISPLVSLIQDQVYQANEVLGITACAFGSYKEGEGGEDWARANRGDVNLVPFPFPFLFLFFFAHFENSFI